MKSPANTKPITRVPNHNYLHAALTKALNCARAARHKFHNLHQQHVSRPYPPENIKYKVGFYTKEGKELTEEEYLLYRAIIGDEAYSTGDAWFDTTNIDTYIYVFGAWVDADIVLKNEDAIT